jgi:hypothetical protein
MYIYIYRKKERENENSNKKKSNPQWVSEGSTQGDGTTPPPL